jgi:hypothetical protein
MNVLPPTSVVQWALTPANWIPVLLVLVGSYLMLRAWRTFRSMQLSEMAATSHTRNKQRLEEISSRWQLLLLGTTGFVLSLASGYTTWMGMTNFTGEATLSLMVTFGIQGVMLIVAWLIGESFATGMNRRLPDGRPASRADMLIGIMLAVTIAAVVFFWLLYRNEAVGWAKSGDMKPVDWSKFGDVALYFALAMLVVGVLAANARRGGDLSLPYVQSSRIIVKNAVLWLMFLACMATSVFFSFDSLFTAIFPKEERARAAQLRAQNQVAGMVADIGSTIETRRVSELDRMFQSKGWLDYDRHLTRLASQSQGAQREIESYFNDQIEQKNRAIKQQQERIASAQGGSAGLVSKKTTLTDELARLKGERPALASDFTEKKNELDNRARGVDAKRVEAQAEGRGAEGTLKQGKGPVYRTLTAELTRLQDAYKIQEERVRDSQRRLATVDTRIAQIERELASVDGDLAKLKAEAQTAEQRIRMTESQGQGETQPRIDPARVLPAFEKARLEYRQDPQREKLAVLHQQCTNLFTAMISTPATKDRVRGIDCDPKQAAEAAAVMFALNDGMKAFDATCTGGDKLEAQRSTDALYGFARSCLGNSGLPARETDFLRGQINFLELSRDDKAHPFVATINAFQDGNRLAYLALGIAVAMDLLVFMSGLFGANALRSPLSDVPSTRARSGRQLEAIVENALLPDKFENARLVLNAMRPMTPHDGFTARVILRDHDPHAQDIRRVLNAASTIGAVRHLDTHDEIYEVRAELFEFLSVVAKKAFEANDENARLAELRKVVTVALQPYVGGNADLTLQHCRPISERNGFSAEIFLDRLAADDAFVVQKVLNAGATLNYVQLDDRPDQSQRYYVHKQLYKTLLMISASAPRTGERSYAPQLGAPGEAHGGKLRSQPPALGDQNAGHPALPGFLAKPASASGPPVHMPGDETTERERLETYFISGFAEALGVAPEVYLGIGGDTFGAALAAADAFKAVQRTNRTLDRLIDDKEREAQIKIDQMYSRLVVAAQAQSKLGRDALDHAFDDVLRNLPIITLLPGGPIETLLRSLTGQLEAQHGEQRLNPDEEELLRLAKRLAGHLSRSTRDTAEAWQRVQAGLMEASPASGPIAFIARRAKRPSGT